MPIVPSPKLVEQIKQALASHESDLWQLCTKIHDNPELAYKEVIAHDSISDLLEKLGFTVRRHAYGLDTAFEVEYGKGGRVVVYNAEYDALPGIGHACGHNLIATASIAAFLATAQVMKENGIEGRVRLLGTPAEERQGGKIDLINAGAYKDVDACLMSHPGPNRLPGDYDGLGPGVTMAMTFMLVKFTGKAAHAGASPWEGKNALDAVVAAYMNVSLLRQQLKPSTRIHGFIKHGGDAPNIIASSTTLEFLVRAETAVERDELFERVKACFEGAARATACEVNIEVTTSYKDLRPNAAMCSTFADYMSLFGRKFVGKRVPGPPVGASTDMGNVSYEIPGFHCMFGIPVSDPHIGPHNPGFTEAAGKKEAFERAFDVGKGMAATGYEILVNNEFANQVWKDFAEEVGVELPERARVKM